METNMFKYSLALLALLTASTTTQAQSINSSWASSYTLEANGEYEKAASLLIPYLHSGERSEFSTLRYAWLNYLQGNFNDATAYYKKAIALNGRSIDAKLGISLPLMAQHRWSEARRHIQQVLAQAPMNYTAHTYLMACEEGLRHWQVLEKHAKKVSSYYPTDATTLIYLARAHAWQGNNLLAKSVYNKVLMRVPENVEALRFLKAYPS